MWTSDDAQRLAGEHLSRLGARWLHVQAAGELAEMLREQASIADLIVAAAWLHDIGYASALTRTGFHPIDGAVYLQGLGAPPELVALVAHHTGASFEANERGLSAEFARLPAPDPANLDVLTFVDLCTGPDGSPMLPQDRIAEISDRYGPDHPVHRAVSRSRGILLASARAGAAAAWPIR